MRPVVFLHNPKAGGTSVTAHMKTLYPANDVAPTLESSAAARAPEAWVPHRSCRFVAGHFGHEVRETHFTNHALITNFRHPFLRIFSLYQFWRNIPEAQFTKLPAVSGPAYAKKLSFGQFVRSDDPFLRVYLENFHTRQIVKSGWLWWECGADDLETAISRVRSMAWFYVCEMPVLSLAWLRNAFPEGSFPQTFPKLNETSGGIDALPAWDEAGVVISRNSLDMDLYHTALRVMEEKSRSSAHG